MKTWRKIAAAIAIIAIAAYVLVPGFVFYVLVIQTLRSCK